MAKPQVVSPDESIPALREAAAASADNYDAYAEAVSAPNRELQDELDTQRAFDDDEPDKPTQPYVLESSAYRNELIAKKAKLDADIGTLEGQRDGMNARIDDMNMTRNAVAAGLATLK